MKPFLLLQLRSIDSASDNEYQSFLRYGSLRESDVERVRMERGGIPNLNLEDFSGVLMGSGLARVSNDTDDKSSSQLIWESDLPELFEELVEKDFPFLGTNYGLCAMANFLHCEVSQERYYEDTGAVTIKLTDRAIKDPITKKLPKEFSALGGHLESCMTIPPNAVLLATSANCPIQMIRIRKNIYATQFNPELDIFGFTLRVSIYRDSGYFKPEHASKIVSSSKDHNYSNSQLILRRFIERYSK